MPISAVTQAVEDREAPSPSLETQLGRSSRSNFLLLLFAFVQPGQSKDSQAISSMGRGAGYTNELPICQSVPARRTRGHRKYKVDSGIKTIRTDYCNIVFEISTL